MNRPTELLDPPRDTDLEVARAITQGDNEDRYTPRDPADVIAEHASTPEEHAS